MYFTVFINIYIKCSLDVRSYLQIKRLSETAINLPSGEICVT